MDFITSNYNSHAMDTTGSNLNFFFFFQAILTSLKAESSGSSKIISWRWRKTNSTILISIGLVAPVIMNSFQIQKRVIKTLKSVITDSLAVYPNLHTLLQTRSSYCLSSLCSSYIGQHIYSIYKWFSLNWNIGRERTNVTYFPYLFFLRLSLEVRIQGLWRIVHDNCAMNGIFIN